VRTEVSIQQLPHTYEFAAENHLYVQHPSSYQSNTTCP